MGLEAAVIKEKHPRGHLGPGGADCLEGLGNGVSGTRGREKFKKLKNSELVKQ